MEKPHVGKLLLPGMQREEQLRCRVGVGAGLSPAGFQLLPFLKAFCPAAGISPALCSVQGSAIAVMV